MIIDTHQHLGRSMFTGKVTTEAELLEAMAQHGVDVMLVMPQPTREPIGPIHDRIAALAERSRGTIFGMASIDPWLSEADYRAEARRCVRNLGFVALKFHPLGHNLPPTHPEGDKVFRQASELGVPVIVHTGLGTPWALPSLCIPPARQYPNLPIILAHAGWGLYSSEAIVAAEVCPNLYLEPSWCPTFAARQMIDVLGADRVLFGSDHLPNLPVELTKYRSIGLTEAQRAQVLGETARAIFPWAVAVEGIAMPARYWLIVGTFLLSMLLYVDRVCISAAKGPVAADLGFDDRAMGWVFAAFSLGYALFQTPGGALADRFGPRRVLALIVSVWSLFTALTATATNLATMLVVRFLFGAGEAGAFPGMTRAFYSWLPVKERGLGHGITFSATRLGAAVALPGIAWLVQAIGWRETFVLLGLIGVVWAVAWYLLFRDDPETHPLVSVSEFQVIREGRPAVAAREPSTLSLAAVLSSSNLWLAMGQYFASNFTFFFCLTWLLPLLSREYELDAVTAGRYAMAPLLAGVVGNWLGGGLVDAIYRRGRWGASRRLPALLGFVLAAVGMGVGSASTTAVSVVVGLTIAILGADMTLSPSWAFCSDIGGRNAGAVSGTMNMAGNLGSFVTALAFPYLQSWTGSVAPFFAVGAGLNVLAAVAWLGARPDRPLGEG